MTFYGEMALISPNSCTMSIGETIALKLGLMVMKMTIACEQTRINACVWLVVSVSYTHLTLPTILRV